MRLPSTSERACRGRPACQAYAPHLVQAHASFPAQLRVGAYAAASGRLARIASRRNAVSVPFDLFQTGGFHDHQLNGHRDGAAGLHEVTSVEVRLTLQRKVSWGRNLAVVGSIPQLGSWQLGGAVHLSWEEGHTWSTVLQLPAGCALSYKFVVVGGDEEAEWQEGPNRTLVVAAPGGLMEVDDAWDARHTRTIRALGMPAAAMEGDQPRAASPPPPEHMEPSAADVEQQAYSDEEPQAAAEPRARVRGKPVQEQWQRPRSRPGTPAGGSSSRPGSRAGSRGGTPTPPVEVLGAGGRRNKRRSWMAGPDTAALLAEGLAALKRLQQQQQETLAALHSPLPAASWKSVMEPGLGGGVGPLGTAPAASAGRAARQSPLSSPLAATASATAAATAAARAAAAAARAAAQAAPAAPAAAPAADTEAVFSKQGVTAAAAASPVMPSTAAPEAAAAAPAPPAAREQRAASPSGRRSPGRLLSSHDDIAAALLSDDFEDACNCLVDALCSCSEDWEEPEPLGHHHHHHHPGPHDESASSVPVVIVTGNAAVGAAAALVPPQGLSRGLSRTQVRKAAFDGVETALSSAWEVTREERNPAAPRVLEADRGLAAATAAMDRLLKA